MNMRANISLVAAMAEMLAPYRDDDEVYSDTLEGETNVMELLDGEIAAMQSDDALAEAIKAQEDALKIRRERISMRADAHKKNIKLILQHAVLQKAERPLATVSIRPGSLSVRIVEEADIPSQLMREKITRAPDKAAIKAQIEAGVEVPGAALERGEDTVSVRVK